MRFLSRGPGYTLSLGRAGAALTSSDGRTVGLGVAGARADAAIEGVDPRPGVVNDLAGSDPARWHTHIPTFGTVAYRDVLAGVDLLFHDRQGTVEYDLVIAPGVDPTTVALDLTGVGHPTLDRHGDLVLSSGPGPIRMHAPVIYQEVAGRRQQVSGGFKLDDDGRIRFRVGTYDTASPLVIDPTVSFDAPLPAGMDAKGIAVDPSGRTYVAATVGTPDFSRISSATATGGAEAVVVRLAPDGKTIEYKTFLSGRDDDAAGGVAVDPTGRAYVTGTTKSDDFPTSPGAFQPTRPCTSAQSCFSQVFVAVLDATGVPTYSTFLGGAPGGDAGHAIAVAASGRAFVAGRARYGSPFPTKAGFISSPCACVYPVPFVAEIDPTASREASLVHSTLLSGRPSGSSSVAAIGVDGSGRPVVAGTTSDTAYPTTPGAFDQGPLRSTNGGTARAFVTMLRPDFSGVVYSTFLQGRSGVFPEGVEGLAVDASGAAHVTGGTASADFPSANATGGRGGGIDAYVTKIDPSGAVLTFSTFLAGNGNDVGNAIAVDASGNIYVGGGTESQDFPRVKPLAGVPVSGAFLTKLRPDGSILYSSYLPTSQAIRGLAVDDDGNAYVSGESVVIKVSTAPVLSAISPAGGPTAGTQVTLSGAGLDDVTKVTIAGQDLPCGASLACRPDAQNPSTTLHLTVPARLPGAVDVTASNPDGASKAVTFTYRAPQVTTIDVTSGPATGGTTVRLGGSDLEGATVQFDTTAAAGVSVSSDGTLVTATVPANRAGPVPVVATTPPGATATAPSLYTYLPAITAVLPPTGSMAGGESVLITGRGLAGATDVTFGGASSGSPIVPPGRDDQLVVAAVPAHAVAETVAVTVVAGGVEAVAVPAGVDRFTYTTPRPPAEAPPAKAPDSAGLAKTDPGGVPTAPGGPSSSSSPDPGAAPSPSPTPGLGSAAPAPADSGAGAGLTTSAPGGPVSSPVPAGQGAGAASPGPAPAPAAASPSAGTASPAPGAAASPGAPSPAPAAFSAPGSGPQAPAPAHSGVAIGHDELSQEAKRYAMTAQTTTGAAGGMDGAAGLAMLGASAMAGAFACLVLDEHRRGRAPGAARPAGSTRRAYAGVELPRRR